MNVEIVEGINGDLSSLLNTVDGSKVYYAYEGVLEKYKEKFEDYQEGQNKLPDRLKKVALELTYSTLVNNQEAFNLWLRLGTQINWVSLKLFRELIEDNSLEEYFNKYNNIKEVK